MARIERPSTLRFAWLLLLLCAALSGCSIDLAGTAEPDAGAFDPGDPTAELRDGGEGPRKPDGGAQVMTDDPPLDGERDAGDQSDDTPPDLMTDAASPGAASDGGKPPGSDVPKPPSLACAPGNFALRMELDVSWSASQFGVPPVVVPVIAAGNGLLTVQALARVEPDGTSANVALCGLDLPEFKAAENPLIGEVYKVFVPDAAWDVAKMPRFDVDWEVGCANAGCAFTTGLLQGVVGARMKGPFAWPKPETRTQLTTSDDDADGKPALSVYSYREPSVNNLGLPFKAVPVLVGSAPITLRISRFLLALGLRAQLDGKLQNCDAMMGTTKVGDFHGRAYGCIGIYDGTKNPADCNPEQSNLVDQHVPNWTTRSGRFRAVRITGSNCAAVRAALPVTPVPPPPPSVQ